MDGCCDYLTPLISAGDLVIKSPFCVINLSNRIFGSNCVSKLDGSCRQVWRHNYYRIYDY